VLIHLLKPIEAHINVDRDINSSRPYYF